MPTWFQHGLSQVNGRQPQRRGDSARPGQTPRASADDGWVTARLTARSAPAVQDTLGQLVQPAPTAPATPAPGGAHRSASARPAHEKHQARDGQPAQPAPHALDAMQARHETRARPDAPAHDAPVHDAQPARDGRRAPEARPAPDAERVPSAAPSPTAAPMPAAAQGFVTGEPSAAVPLRRPGAAPRQAATGEAAAGETGPAVEPAAPDRAFSRGGRSRTRTLRVGVVGVGYWGAKHVRALEKVDGVSAVVAIDERLADEPNSSLAALGIDQYSELAEALPHVDALVIATPPSTHTAIGLEAIAAGKHVLIEKPLATSASEARSLITAAEAADVVLMSGHTFEHNAAVHKLRELVRGRDLGQLYYLDCARLNLGLYRDDVGVIADLAPHDISIANYVLSSRPTTVTAWGSRFVGPEHEDVAFLRLDYADIGVRASVQVSWLSPVKVRRITAVGSQRMAVYDDLAEDERIRIYNKSAVPAARTSGEQRMTYHTGDTVLPYVEFAEPLAVQDQEFVSCIRSGRTPDADGNSGLSVVQVLDAAQLSMREQRPVSIAELSHGPADGTPLRLAGDPPLRTA